MTGNWLIRDNIIAYEDKLTYTFTVTQTTDIGIMIKAYDGIYRIKLEKGDVSTDWEPYL